MTFYIRLFIVFIAAFTNVNHVKAEDGIADSTITFGQTAALEGPASALGQGMKIGISAAFQEANKAGGVNGRTLELISYDDGYEPHKAIENTKKLIYNDKVFALIGGVGTPTANAIEPITSVARVPFIGPFTGAEFLRSPYKRYVVNIRASYWQETEEWIERLTSDLGVKRVAILYQDDTYGRAGLSGVERALKKRGLSLVGRGTYKRNTTAVKGAALAIRKSNPEAVVMVGAYKPCAEFIKIAKKINLNPLFINISFVGSDALSKELGDAGEGVIISQVVPFPYSGEDSTLVQRYQNAMKEAGYDAALGFVTLEGYMAGRFVIEILRSIKNEVTRETFLDQVYALQNITLDDVSLKYGIEDNQGMDQVFMTVIQKNQTFKSIETLNDIN